MNHDGNFKEDLEFSKQAEKYTEKKLKTKWPLARVLVGYNKDGDVEIPEIKELGEVKFDRQTLETGNLFIEYESRKKPSGIVTTKSDFWVYYYNPNNFEDHIYIRTKKLKEAINELKPKKVAGGDSWTSMGYLLNLKKLREFLKK